MERVGEGQSRMTSAAQRSSSGGESSLVAHPCGMCQSTEYRQLFRLADIPVVRCKSCGHVYSLLQDTAPLDLYDQQYYSSVRRDQRPVTFALAEVHRQRTERETFARRIAAIEARLGGRGRLLDVGCGLGEFLAVARGHGWEGEGIEPSEFAAQSARERHRLNVHTGTLDSVPLRAGSYDVVTLYDVIEHIPEPRPFLSRVFQLLRAGGLLHLVTPNIDSPSARLLGKRWYHLKPREHLHYFSRETVARLLTEATFQTLAVRPTLDVVTVAYVLDRLRAYNTHLFGWLLGLSLRLGGAGFQFSLPLGEMEAWARKP
ncbi:MAG: class I SAM-dependent methyltransferase [Chloroflexi bacterium]|nr:class I SAM-dependent methyltransferase [Chloroflexota bacterium]